MGLPPIETVQDWSVKDTILYALGVGTASDGPVDRSELQFVYEEGLKILSTMTVVMGYPGFWGKDPKYRLNW